MSNPTSVVVLDDTLAQFLARTNQFGESNQDLIQQKFNKKEATGSANPVFAALESRSRAVAQWGNLMDDLVLAFMADGSGSGLVLTGTGTPEGVVTADVGALYLDTGVTAADGPVVYSKETGVGNTGWVAMAPTRADGGVFGRGALGTHTVAGTETLTADTSYLDLTVPAGTVLETAGFRLWVQDFVQVDATGTIRSNGTAAVDELPAGGAAAVGGSLGPGTIGGAGGSFGAGAAGGSPVADTSGGAAGGAGGGGNGGAGGAAGAIDAPDADQGALDAGGWPHLGAVVGFDAAGPGAIIVLSGGTGGGGGGGDGVDDPGGGGGGGGGVLVMATRNLINNGTIEANGGDGANGDSGGQTGGGGGGGGGLVVTVARFRSGSGTITATAGGAGTGAGGGAAGIAGTVGVTLEFAG